MISMSLEGESKARAATEVFVADAAVERTIGS